MADQELIQQLKTAALESINRGFAILICEPHQKDPWAKYSPHAVNSCSRVLEPTDPAYALKAWDDGHEANYGVGGGPSNLTIVDVDTGIPNATALKNWMQSIGLPETFTVQTGRDGQFGAHLYYSGAVKTTPYQIEGVVGELRGIGAYVVGPGSIHPSGKKYTIINDIPPVPLPAGMVALAGKNDKKGLEFTPAAKSGELIPEGNRWVHLQSKAGTFRNAGLDRDGIYHALKNFAANNCENGADYPDDKIQALADAAAQVFNAAEATPIVFFGDGKKIDVNIQELPTEAIEGDWIGELTHHVADGTFIPPTFARAQIKTILGASLDGLVGFPHHPDLNMKHWTMLISLNPEAGKGMSWKRTGESALANYIAKSGVAMPRSGWFSSGEHLIKKLCDEAYEGKNTLTYFDELATLFMKGAAQNSTLFKHMTELYDRSDGSAGSLSHEGGEFKNISISFTGGFTSSSFDAAISGKGAGGDGFLSRCVLAYTGAVKHEGDWGEQDTTAINKIAENMLARWGQLKTEFSKNKQRFVPLETEEAKHLRQQFSKALAKRRKEQDASGLQDTISRIEKHFKSDLLLRAIFSGDVTTPLEQITITADMVKRSIAWAEYEIYLRDELWPVDKGNLVERMEQSMRRALKKHEHLTKMQLQDACNVHRAGSGGMTTFNMAWSAVLKGGMIEVVGRTHKGTEKFGLVS
jgi:hypothetical protein